MAKTGVIPPLPPTDMVAVPLPSAFSDWIVKVWLVNVKLPVDVWKVPDALIAWPEAFRVKVAISVESPSPFSGNVNPSSASSQLPAKFVRLTLAAVELWTASPARKYLD